MTVPFCFWRAELPLSSRGGGADRRARGSAGGYLQEGTEMTRSVRGAPVGGSAKREARLPRKKERNRHHKRATRRRLECGRCSLPDRALCIQQCGETKRKKFAWPSNRRGRRHPR